MLEKLVVRSCRTLPEPDFEKHSLKVREKQSF